VKNLEDLDVLRQEALRTWRLAADCADLKLKADLTAYVLEVEDRAARMEAALKSNGAGAASEKTTK